MDTYLNATYWFSSFPGDPNLMFWRIAVSYAVATLVVAAVAIIFARRNRKDGLRRKLWNKWLSWGFTIGPVILLLRFFRFEGVTLLSMRFLVFIWLLSSFIWFLFIVRYLVFKHPKKLRAREHDQAFKQYLPQRKH